MKSHLAQMRRDAKRLGLDLRKPEDWHKLSVVKIVESIHPPAEAAWIVADAVAAAFEAAGEAEGWQVTGARSTFNKGKAAGLRALADWYESPDRLSVSPAELT
jgi:hypothetical protein